MQTLDIKWLEDPTYFYSTKKVKAKVMAWIDISQCKKQNWILVLYVFLVFFQTLLHKQTLFQQVNNKTMSGEIVKWWL